AYLNLHRFDTALAALRDALRLRPADREVRALVDEVARLAPDGPVTEKPLSGPAVLVAAASGAVRKLAQLTAEPHGSEVRSAADGYEAVDLLRDHGPPALVLLDVDLPGLDGYQLCRLLRQNAATADLPILLLTDQDGFLARMRGRLAGATEHL